MRPIILGISDPACYILFDLKFSECKQNARCMRFLLRNTTKQAHCFRPNNSYYLLSSSQTTQISYSSSQTTQISYSSSSRKGYFSLTRPQDKLFKRAGISFLRQCTTRNDLSAASVTAKLHWKVPWCPWTAERSLQTTTDRWRLFCKLWVRRWA